MTTSPEISGYSFEEQLLDHPLAEIWRGRSSTGMDVVMLQLSESGAADAAVRRRLELASRMAALEPARSETPLWAGNFTTSRPYAVTQLLPDQAGVERFLDPLDGIIGNDQTAIEQVRQRLLASASYVDSPAPGQYDGQQTDVPAGAFDKWAERMGWRFKGVIVIAVLVLFSISYSAGAVIRSAADDPQPVRPKVAAPAPVSPSPLPTGALRPGMRKAIGARYQPGLKPVQVVGAVYTATDKTELVQDIGLPFVFRWPGKYDVMAESESDAIYRTIVSDTTQAPVGASIAVYPCRDLAACLAERIAFDARWTKAYPSARPATAKDSRTWYTVDRSGARLPSFLTMTRVFEGAGGWWLAGVAVGAKAGHERSAEKVLNDIRTQTP